MLNLAVGQRLPRRITSSDTNLVHSVFFCFKFELQASAFLSKLCSCETGCTPQAPVHSGLGQRRAEAECRGIRDGGVPSADCMKLPGTRVRLHIPQLQLQLPTMAGVQPASSSSVPTRPCPHRPHLRCCARWAGLPSMRCTQRQGLLQHPPSCRPTALPSSGWCSPHEVCGCHRASASCCGWCGCGGCLCWCCVAERLGGRAQRAQHMLHHQRHIVLPHQRLQGQVRVHGLDQLINCSGNHTCIVVWRGVWQWHGPEPFKSSARETTMYLVDANAPNSKTRTACKAFTALHPAQILKQGTCRQFVHKPFFEFKPLSLCERAVCECSRHL